MYSTNTSPAIPIVFEDEHLLIIDKPTNMLSQKDHTGDPDVVTLCKDYLSNHRINKSPYIGLLHRLDRPVSGLMMLAKTKQCARRMSELMKDQRVDKTYWAVVSGQTHANGYYEHFLRKDSNKNMVTAHHQKKKGTKRAALTYQRLSHNESPNISMVSVHLLTGRSHQIRVQFASEGHPVLYDHKYGGKTMQQNKNIALFSTALRFTHPITNEHMKFRALPKTQDPWKYFSVEELARKHLPEYDD